MAARTTDTAADHGRGGPMARRRFLRRAGTVLGVGLGITMTATPAWAPPSCVTRCTRVAPCWACSGLTFFECRCSGGSPYYRCEYRCTDSFCRSVSRCV
jgi:hypothetical protein